MHLGTDRDVVRAGLGRMSPDYDSLAWGHRLTIEDLTAGQVALDRRAVPGPHPTKGDYFLYSQGGVGVYVDPKVRHFDMSYHYRRHASMRH